MGLQLGLKNKIFEKVIDLTNEKGYIHALIISSEKEFLRNVLIKLNNESKLRTLNRITLVYPCDCGNSGSKRSCTCPEEEHRYARSEIRELSRRNDIVVSIENIVFDDIILVESLPSVSVNLLRSIYDTYSLTLDRLDKVIRVADAIWGKEQGDYRDALKEAVNLCISMEFNHASKYKGAGICQKI